MQSILNVFGSLVLVVLLAAMVNADSMTDALCKRLHHKSVTSSDTQNDGCLLTCSIHAYQYVHMVSEGSNCGKNLAGICKSGICTPRSMTRFGFVDVKVNSAHLHLLLNHFNSSSPALVANVTVKSQLETALNKAGYQCTTSPMKTTSSNGTTKGGVEIEWNHICGGDNLSVYETSSVKVLVDVGVAGHYPTSRAITEVVGSVTLPVIDLLVGEKLGGKPLEATLMKGDTKVGVVSLWVTWTPVMV